MSGWAVGGAVIGGIIAAEGSKSAAKTAAGAQRESGEIIYKQFKETEKRLLPYSEGGLKAFEQQQALSGAEGPEAQQAAYDAYAESPGVAFARERGLRGIDRGAAAPGGNDLFSGNVDKARIGYSQGLALQDFNNYWNRLGSVAGTGLAATQAIGGVGSQAAQGQAQAVSNAGLMTAQGQVAAGQSYQSGLSSLGSALGNLYQNRPNQGYLTQPQGNINPNIYRTA